MIPSLSTTEKTKLAAIILREIGPEAILFIVLSRPKNTAELVSHLSPFIPGDTLRDKISYGFTQAREAFASDARFAQVAAGVLEKLRGVTEDEAPPPSSLTGQESGFLWKPVGDNSRKLRVLLPPEFTGHVDLSSCTLWHGGEQIEKLTPIGPANPLPGRGEREHFAGRKPGGAYPAEIKVRCIADGISWVWPIANPSARNENVKAES